MWHLMRGEAQGCCSKSATDAACGGCDDDDSKFEIQIEIEFKSKKRKTRAQNVVC